MNMDCYQFEGGLTLGSDAFSPTWNKDLGKCLFFKTYAGLFVTMGGWDLPEDDT